MGENRVQYGKVESGLIEVMGLPDGMRCKKPSSYSLNDLDRILSGTQITFRATSKAQAMKYILWFISLIYLSLVIYETLTLLCSNMCDALIDRQMLCGFRKHHLFEKIIHLCSEVIWLLQTFIRLRGKQCCSAKNSGKLLCYITRVSQLLKIFNNFNVKFFSASLWQISMDHHYLWD